jgi:hypothetical protein
MMGAWRMFKRPWSFRLGVWTFRVIPCDHRVNLGFPSVMKVLMMVHEEAQGSATCKDSFQVRTGGYFSSIASDHWIRDDTPALSLGESPCTIGFG